MVVEKVKGVRAAWYRQQRVRSRERDQKRQDGTIHLSVCH